MINSVRNFHFIPCQIEYWRNFSGLANHANEVSGRLKWKGYVILSLFFHENAICHTMVQATAPVGHVLCLPVELLPPLPSGYWSPSQLSPEENWILSRIVFWKVFFLHTASSTSPALFTAENGYQPRRRFCLNRFTFDRPPASGSIRLRSHPRGSFAPRGSLFRSISSVPVFIFRAMTNDRF